MLYKINLNHHDSGVVQASKIVEVRLGIRNARLSIVVWARKRHKPP
jgi:hypothetical protein